ncbi:MAG: hypothetical protein KatS3mg115_0619 [Candidatus Poribacteria bacterium]|nr:MAG: hypothetical protein KatS3mg115_0619 [Candidatus Poribacteria bacterium]
MRIHAEEIGANTIADLRQKTPQELKEDLRTLRELQMRMRFQRVFGTLEQTHKLRQNRKNIARILTVLREKQIQHFLLNDPEVQELLDSGKVRLSAGKNDPKRPIRREDISGNDARSVTLAMRLWAMLRRRPDFFNRTRQIPRI